MSMNKEQIAYQAGRAFNSVFVNGAYLSAAVLFGIITKKMIPAAIEDPNFETLFYPLCFAASALGAGLTGLYETAVKSMLIHKSVKSNPKDCPLDYAKRIIINDKDGLDCLLEKTRKREPQAWGTFLTAHDEGDIAIIDKIHDTDQMLCEGLIEQNKNGKMYLKARDAAKRGFNGSLDYLPDNRYEWLSAKNYAVPADKKLDPANWINLETFNIPVGDNLVPQIIAFNNKHVYLPVGTKDELYQAGPKRIMQYLQH